MEVERRSFLNSAVHANYRREEPGYPWNRGLDGPKCRSARSEEEKKLVSLPWFEPRTVQPVAQSLYTLLQAETSWPEPDTVFLIGINVDALKLYKKYHKTPCGTSLQRGVRTGSSCHYNPGPRKCSNTKNVLRVYTERRGCMEPNTRVGKTGWEWTAQVL